MTIIRPRIVQHCAMPDSHGGPMTGLRLLINSELREKYDFRTVFQTRPACGINITLIREMAAEMRRHQPDLIHIRGLQNEGLHGIIAAKASGCRKIIVSVHGSIGELNQTSWLKRKVFYHLLEPLTLSLANRFYCVCNAQTSRFNHKRNFAGVIHNAAPIYNPQRQRAAMRNELGLAKHEIACIYVGRMSAEKGLQELANAIDHFLKHDPMLPLRFIMVGDGPMEAIFRNRFTKMTNRVSILGRRNDVQELLSASDIFLFPTLHENLSNALLEACTASLTIIATDVGGNPEVITNGKNGLLVPPGDTSALGRAIKHCAADQTLRTKLGTAACLQASTKFSQKQLLKRLENLYDELLKRNYA